MRNLFQMLQWLFNLILLFFSIWSGVSVNLVVLGSSSFFSISVDCVTCWWQACFFLCCSRIAYQFVRILEQVWELHSLKMSLFCLCIWMVVRTNFLSFEDTPLLSLSFQCWQIGPVLLYISCLPCPLLGRNLLVSSFCLSVLWSLMMCFGVGLFITVQGV